MPDVGEGSQNKTLVRGVLVLMPAALFTKLVGLFYKIPLLFIVGVEGMAYFLAAYHVYAVLFVLSATGLPTALSLQVARATARGDTAATARILRVSLTAFLAVGALGTLTLLLGAEAFADALAIKEAAGAIRAIAPSLLLATFIGAVKGYFQGHSRMGATAMAEVLEAAGKLGFGLFFATLAKRTGRGAPDVAAAAILGITAGLMLSALFLAVCLVSHRVRARGTRGACTLTRRAILAELWRVALPVTLGASVMSITSLLDTALISARLQAAGFAADAAHAMYSSYGNLAIPLYNLVPSLLTPITLSLMPLLGSAMARGEVARTKEAWSSALRIVILICVPASLGLAIFSTPLLSLIFAGQAEAVSFAAPLLTVLAMALLPAGLMTLMSAALQATGRTHVPVLAALAGALVKLAVECVLLVTPRIYLTGAPISTVACTLTVLLVEWRALARVLPFESVTPRALWRPLLAALPALGAGLCVYRWGLSQASSSWLILAVLAVVVVLYVPCALLWHAVEREDILALPGGALIAQILEKIHLLKGSEIHDKRRKAAVYSAKEGI